MASTIIFGLLFSTLTALLLVPCLYGLFDDLKVGRQRRTELRRQRQRA
jgi:Cu/Ag efflux pump CusA